MGGRGGQRGREDREGEREMTWNVMLSGTKRIEVIASFSLIRNYHHL